MRQPLLRHVYLAVVHEVDQGLQVTVPYILKDDNRVFARVQDKQRLQGREGLFGGGRSGPTKTTYLKVGAACGEDDLVGLQLAALGRQGDIHQVLIVQKRRKDRYEIRLVVIPPQTKLLH